jgi:superfamily II RNA helicase
MMGKIADAIRGTALPEQNKKKLLKLDQEFEQMEAKLQSLNSENLKLRAQVNPLEREVERLNKQIKKTVTHQNNKLDHLSETILVDIANGNRIVREQYIRNRQLDLAKGQYHFDVLVEKKFIVAVTALPLGVVFSATPQGRKYLARHNLL